MRSLGFQILITGLLCISSAQAAPENGSCRELLLRQAAGLTLYRATDTIPTPESLPLVTAAQTKLSGFILLAKGTGPTAEIYREALPQIERALDSGRAILSNGASDQNQVYEYFHLFAGLVDFPQNYADSIGRIADGFDFVHGFTEEKLQERLNEFLLRYKSAKPVLASEVKRLEKIRENLLSGFKYISVGPYELPDDLKFSFQYRYIFREGVLTLRDLFENREAGAVYLGVSFQDLAPHDGQFGDSQAFLRHDLLHAYTQKYFDQQVFDQFKANTLDKKIKLKSITHSLLKARVNEYLAIEDRNLRLAVEVIFFAMLHEYSLSYPAGVHQESSQTERWLTIGKSIPYYLKEGRFGDEYRDIPETTIHLAMEWLKARARTDEARLRADYATRTKSEPGTF